MQSRFLSLFHELTHSASIPIKGLWLIHGDEPLISQWLIDACRPHWSAHAQRVVRMELTSPKSWQTVLSELSALDLFGDNIALIVSGKHKPDTKELDALARFANDCQQGQTHNHLLWCLPKQDKKSLTTQAIKLFDTHGQLIDANLYNEHTRLDVLRAQASLLGLSLTPEAWQLLMTDTENSLLTAHQTLWRLSYLYPPQTTIDPKALAQSLVEGREFDVFALSDAILMADAPKVLHILAHLRHTDTAPSLVLWALNKDARLILQLQAGKDPKELGIWQNKLHLYQHACQRTQKTNWHWITDIYEIDKAIKGLGNNTAWQQIEKLAIAMCGIISPLSAHQVIAFTQTGCGISS